LQQRAWATKVKSAFVPVGCPLDDCEQEADQFAAEALGTGLRSPITPDRAGAIRRVVNLAESTATMGPDDHEDAKPDYSIRPSMTSDGPLFMAVNHLSRNADVIVHGCPAGQTCAPYDARAIQITGRVLLSGAGSRMDVLEAWALHFRQYFFLQDETYLYAGRASSEGSMTIKLHVAPGMPVQGYVPDTDSGPGGEFPDNALGKPDGGYATVVQEPNTRLFGGPAWSMTITMTDHPFAEIPMTWTNYATRKENYLYLVSRQYSVITVLIAINKRAQAVTPLQSVRWGARSTASVRWRRPPRRDYLEAQWPRNLISEFTVEAVVDGAPPEGSVAALARRPEGDPGGKSYNDLIRAAYLGALRSTADSPNVTARTEWSKDVPKDLVQ
jgi:hypothetical protein